MKVTLYAENGELVQTLWGGTAEHIDQSLRRAGFKHAHTYEQTPHTFIYVQTPRKHRLQEAVLAVIQPLDEPLLSHRILKKYLT